MSEGSEEDGLDGIKEEDEEDEEERLAKLAALKKQQQEQEDALRRQEEEERRRREAEQKANEEVKKKAQLEADWKRRLREQVEIDDLARKANSKDEGATQKLKAKREELKKKAESKDGLKKASSSKNSLKGSKENLGKFKVSNNKAERQNQYKQFENQKEKEWLNSQGGANEKQKLKDLETVRDLIKKALSGDQNAANKLHKMMEDQMKDPSEVEGDSPSESEVAARQCKELDDEKEHLWRAGYGDPDAQRKLQELEYVRDLRKKALAGDQDAIAKLKKLMEEQKKKAKSGD